MAEVRPFRALAYDELRAGPLESLVAPPYDVISPRERTDLLARSPYNATHLILPDRPYDAVGALIDEWRQSGVLEQAGEPYMVGWTQDFAVDGVPHTRHTILATVRLEPYEARVVRPHERTHSGPKEDRLRLISATRTNLSPVFGLYSDPAGEAWEAAEAEPEREITSDDGTRHRLWRIRDPRASQAVAAALAERWILIADGHHRYETALAYRDARRLDDHPFEERPYDFTMMGLTALEDPGLVVLPTHRILSRWPNGAASALTARTVYDLQELQAALAAAPSDRPAFGVVRAGGAQLVTGHSPPDGSPSAALDAAVLEREVLVKALRDDQAALTRRGVLGYTKDAAEAWRLGASGEAAAAIVMRPVPKAAVAAVAEAGETMPQKSTYFFPKLLTGIAFHPL